MSIPLQPVVESEQPGSQGRVSRKICVADDEGASRTLLKLLLSKWGYEVVECRDGNEAFCALSLSDGPRLALLDWMMPVHDGLEICRRLRAERSCANYYLVLVTARTDEADVISALRQGADDFVSKPYSPHVLQARVEVGFRTLDLQRKISEFGNQMQRLAVSRAAQLVHADRMASLGMLSASVAHEINNPTSFLSVNVQTLRKIWPAVGETLSGRASQADAAKAKALADEMPAVLQEMEEGVSRIRQITSELRSFSRAGTGEPRVVSVEQSLRKALRICSVRVNDLMEVELDLDADLPSVMADSTRLEQVFVNLILNAADAVEDGPVRRLRISAAPGPENIRIRFQDTGAGVPPEKVGALFQPFFTTKSSGKGTGLGLYISRGLIEEFGGTLELAPSDGSGACFDIVLPALETRA